MTLTQEVLQAAIKYDPETGKFTWRAPRPKVKVGAEAGYIDKLGYRWIRIDLKLYRAARLACLYMTNSKWPADEVDHINGVPDDNRWSNLRDATRAENCLNRRGWSSLGIKGVTFHKHSGLWRSEISVNRKRNYLGYFKTPELAHEAYVAAAHKLHGEFARTQ